MDHCSTPSPAHKNKNPSPKSQKKFKSTAANLLTITSFLLVVIFQALGVLKSNSSEAQMSSETHHTRPTQDLIFHPLREPKVPPYTDPNRTWFMSTLMGQSNDGMPEHFVFPSYPPNNRVLCVNTRRKSYALAAAENRFPANATVFRGLTFIADSFYDYGNPWHSLNSLSVFFSWMMERGCMKPTRFVVLKNGELVKRVGDWISTLIKACLGGDLVIDSLESHEIACFEKAVIFRRGLGKMSSERRHRLFDMIRCKAWKFCNATERDEREGDLGGLRISLIGRERNRSFRNESGVRLVMESECNKFNGCKLKLVHLRNMTFCDQVRLMRNTDIFATSHGAQLTNMMFMPRGSSVMEMFPRGWLEGAGIGQYIYQWFASWSEMKYEGAWRDNEGINCSNFKKHPSNCFHLQKNQQVGLNETFLADWTSRVIHSRANLSNTNGLKDSNVSKVHPHICPCDDDVPMAHPNS